MSDDDGSSIFEAIWGVLKSFWEVVESIIIVLASLGQLLFWLILLILVVGFVVLLFYAALF